MNAKLHITLLSTVLALSAAACGGDKGGGDAQLTIVGDRNVFLDNEDVATLRVRYHDGADNPLRGQVEFRIVGSAGGSVINRSSGITNADGMVEIQLTAGTSGASSFQIEATADYASAVNWNVSVGSGIPDLDPVGRYELDSKLDIVSGLDNDVGDVLNTFIDMTDEPNDPGKWIVDRALEEAPSGIRNALNLIRGTIDPAVNELIMDNAPGFVADLVDIGEQLGDVTRNFGLISTLDIRKLPAGDVDAPQYSASHLVTGVKFEIQGESYSWTMAELGVSPILAEDVIVSKNNQNMLAIGEHALPLTYGSAIRVVLEQVIIPSIDSDAADLGDFLQNKVNCTAVGQKIYDIGGDEIPLTTPDTYEGLCEFALEAAAALIIEQILNIDNVGVGIDVNGLARPRDTNGDRKVDQLQAGKWNGFIDYDGTQATMDPENNTFTGVRLTVNQ